MRKRIISFWTLWWIGAVFWAWAEASHVEGPVQSAALVSWDGADREVVRELLTAGKLPALAALVEEGSLQEIEIQGHRTSTMPSHATMLTGYLPNVHRNQSNDFVKAIPEGLTIFERMERGLGTNAIQTIMVAGKTRNLGGATPNDVYGISRPQMDHFDCANRLGSDVVLYALPVLARLKTPSFFKFLHFPDPDKAVIRGGILPDVPATILARLGLDLASLNPPLAGQPLTSPNKPTAVALPPDENRDAPNEDN